MTLIRAFPNGDLSLGRDGRTVTGVAVPFGVQADVNDGYGMYREEFRRGAFTRTIAERGNRVKVLAQHNRNTMPIGRATLLREDPAGLYAELRISQTTAGDEALELIRDGALDGLSIGFNAIRDERGADGTVIRTEVRLNEISVVPFAAYESATITGVRSQDARPHLNLARARLALIEATLNLKEERR
ncbi:HK97 family phage prohead protease [Nonomuraea jabiensis]|uniref:HK97 family phage prohead protease n=1 Tax=Nonomuraea jabiensis TaxID=882448 RepID=A0A7W9LA42_9ACTN|nr:HK97 family phage prohead protease [Nonomuraea jabiensis]MBB5776232.1 HK97 family phage prohead protease [Nonomuraea jabiensis]